jgi:uncharacterized protein
MSDSSTLPRVQPCPICRRPAVEPFRPFCSKRCADVDLGRWLSDVYVVPGRDEDDEEEVARPPKPAGDET